MHCGAREASATTQVAARPQLARGSTILQHLASRHPMVQEGTRTSTR